MDVVTPTLDPDVLSRWIGRTDVMHDVIRPAPVGFMEMTLDRDPVLGMGDRLPPLWHWLYFLSGVRLTALGRDGHPALGGFLPPVGLPRRMWAGGRVSFDADLPIGAEVERRSSIRDVQVKRGRSGDLCFVTVGHEIGLRRRPAVIREEHDIVFRQDPAPDDVRPAPSPAAGDWAVRERMIASEVMLFRYSALTFNGHRIHYDRDYARNVEGHDGLVVHGPLIATLLADLAQRQVPDARLRCFEYRAISPVFDTVPVDLVARPVDGGVHLGAVHPDGNLAMRAEAQFHL